VHVVTKQRFRRPKAKQLRRVSANSEINMKTDVNEANQDQEHAADENEKHQDVYRTSRDRQTGMRLKYSEFCAVLTRVTNK